MFLVVQALMMLCVWQGVSALFGGEVVKPEGNKSKFQSTSGLFIPQRLEDFPMSVFKREVVKPEGNKSKFQSTSGLIIPERLEDFPMLMGKSEVHYKIPYPEMNNNAQPVKKNGGSSKENTTKATNGTTAKPANNEETIEKLMDKLIKLRDSDMSYHDRRAAMKFTDPPSSTSPSLVAVPKEAIETLVNNKISSNMLDNLIKTAKEAYNEGQVQHVLEDVAAINSLVPNPPSVQHPLVQSAVAASAAATTTVPVQKPSRSDGIIPPIKKLISEMREIVGIGQMGGQGQYNSPTDRRMMGPPMDPMEPHMGPMGHPMGPPMGPPMPFHGPMPNMDYPYPDEDQINMVRPRDTRFVNRHVDDYEDQRDYIPGGPPADPPPHNYDDPPGRPDYPPEAPDYDGPNYPAYDPHNNGGHPPPDEDPPHPGDGPDNNNKPGFFGNSKHMKPGEEDEGRMRYKTKLSGRKLDGGSNKRGPKVDFRRGSLPEIARHAVGRMNGKQRRKLVAFVGRTRGPAASRKLADLMAELMTRRAEGDRNRMEEGMMRRDRPGMEDHMDIDQERRKPKEDRDQSIKETQRAEAASRFHDPDGDHPSRPRGYKKPDKPRLKDRGPNRKLMPPSVEDSPPGDDGRPEPIMPPHFKEGDDDRARENPGEQEPEPGPPGPDMMMEDEGRRDYIADRGRGGPGRPRMNYRGPDYRERGR